MNGRIHNVMLCVQHKLGNSLEAALAVEWAEVGVLAQTQLQLFDSVNAQAIDIPRTGRGRARFASQAQVIARGGRRPHLRTRRCLRVHA